MAALMLPSSICVLSRLLAGCLEVMILGYRVAMEQNIALSPQYLNDTDYRQQMYPQQSVTSVNMGMVTVFN